MTGFNKPRGADLSAVQIEQNTYIGEQRSNSTSLYIVLTKLAGMIENHIGDLKKTFRIMFKRFCLRDNKFEHFDSALGTCMALHNIRHHFNDQGVRNES